MASVTRSGVILLDVQSPRPTEAPIMLDLARRQNSFTYFVAPDGICGWDSQNITSAFFLLLLFCSPPKSKMDRERGREDEKENSVKMVYT